MIRGITTTNENRADSFNLTADSLYFHKSSMLPEPGIILKSGDSARQRVTYNVLSGISGSAGVR
jgi:hypothetical protein